MNRTPPLSAGKGLGRRAAVRVECDLPIQFQVADEGPSGDARCRNVSLAGARVDLPVELNVSTGLTLVFSYGEHRISIPCRVVWTVTDRVDGPFPAGLTFLSLSDPQRRLLFGLLHGEPPPAVEEPAPSRCLLD